MAIEKQTYKFIFFTALVLLAGFAIYWFFIREPQCDPNRNGYDKKGNPNPKCKVNDPTITHTPPPTGCSTWIPDTSFPLKKCAWGSKVRAIQQALGFTGTALDGRWGPITESAVQAKLGKNIISEDDYNKLINSTPSSSNTSNGNIGKFAYALNDGTEVYNSSDYSVYKTYSADEFIGKIIKNSPSTSSLNYTINGGFIVPVADVYFKQ